MSFSAFSLSLSLSLSQHFLAWKSCSPSLYTVLSAVASRSNHIFFCRGRRRDPQFLVEFHSQLGHNSKKILPNNRTAPLSPSPCCCALHTSPPSSAALRRRIASMARRFSAKKRLRLRACVRTRRFASLTFRQTGWVVHPRSLLSGLYLLAFSAAFFSPLLAN